MGQTATTTTCKTEKNSAADIAGIRAATEKYRTSWLTGDAQGMLGTFTDDGVIRPAEGGAPVVGREAIRNDLVAQRGVCHDDYKARYHLR